MTAAASPGSGSRRDPDKSPGTTGEARCPTCKGPVAPDGSHRPFCCDRCRLADLGRWFREDYVVSRPLRPDDRPETPDDGE